MTEDLRDDPCFDFCAVRLEQALAAHRDMLSAVVGAIEGAAQ